MKRLAPLLITFIILLAPLQGFTIKSSLMDNIDAAAMYGESNNLNTEFTSSYLNFALTSIGEEQSIHKTSVGSFIDNNLALLSSMCLLLVIINLVVQIKIIIQMIHLFFLFRKKEDFAQLKF